MKETVDIIFFCVALILMLFTALKIFAIGEPAVSYYIDGVATTTFLTVAIFNLNRH